MSNFKRLIPRETPSRRQRITKRDSKGRLYKKSVTRAVINANIAEGVEIFADEQHLFHILLRRRENDPVAKEYKDFDNIQSFVPSDVAQMQTSGYFKQYDTVEILHDPTRIEGPIDPETFYEKDGKDDFKNRVQADYEADLEKAKQTLANHELNQKRQTLAETQMNMPSSVTNEVYTPPASPSGPAPEDVAKETKEVTKELKAIQKEYKKLFEVDAPEGTSIEELTELINAKKGETK